MTMKRNLFHIFAVAAAAVAFAACSADSDIDSPRPDEGYTITLRTDGIIGDTRTEFDPAINQIKWSATDKAVFYSNGIGRISEITLGDGGKYADFKLSGMRPDMQEDRTRTIQGFYPVEARWHDGHQRDENNQITAFALNLKSRQEAPSTTFDPHADILVAENLQIELADDETEKTIENVRFGRPVAITEIKYVITNATLVASNEQVRSITLHVDNADNNKYLAGNFYFNPETFRYVGVDGEELASGSFFDSALASSVQVMLSDTPAVNADFTAWVVTAPVALTTGDTLEFTIRTTAGTVITKTVEVNKTVAFSNTRRNTLTVKIDDTATVTTGSAEAIAEGYYVIATDDYMMTTDVVGNALERMTLPTEYIGGKLSVSEDKAIWYIEQAADGTYTVSSKLNGQFVFCDTKSTCYLRSTATPLKIQPGDASGKYNISVNSTAGRVLGYNNSHPRFAFYDNNSSMINDLQIIPVYIDNTPSFDLLKDEITVSAVGDYTEKDVYQLRNAAAVNILIDVDGAVVTSASIADAAVTFTVAKAEVGTNGWIKLDFNGVISEISIIISEQSSDHTENFETVVGEASRYVTSSWESNGFTWNCVYCSTEISSLSSNNKNIAIGKNGYVQTSGTNGIKSLSFDYKGVSNSTTLVVTITNGEGTTCYTKQISVSKNSTGSINVLESDINPACTGNYTIKIANTSNNNAIQIGPVTWTE